MTQVKLQLEDKAAQIPARRKPSTKKCPICHTRHPKGEFCPVCSPQPSLPPKNG